MDHESQCMYYSGNANTTVPPDGVAQNCHPLPQLCSDDDASPHLGLRGVAHRQRVGLLVTRAIRGVDYYVYFQPLQKGGMSFLGPSKWKGVDLLLSFLSEKFKVSFLLYDSARVPMFG